MSKLATTFAASFPTPGAALQCLNESLGGRYTLSRLGTWRNGVRPIPAAVRHVMLNRTLQLLLSKHLNLDPSYRDDLRESIMDLAA